MRSIRVLLIAAIGLQAVALAATKSPTKSATKAPAGDAQPKVIKPVSLPKKRLATAEEVEKAIGKAIDYLYKQQKNGNWEMVDKPIEGLSIRGMNWGGQTAMTTYALLAAGEEQQKEPIKKAIEFLKTANITGCYSIGFRTQVWNLVRRTDEIRRLAQRDADLIIKSLGNKDDGDGMTHYTLSGKPTSSYDHSNSQYAVLGLWACAQVGVEIPPSVWKQIESSWQKHQTADGGWAYARMTIEQIKDEGTGKMKPTGKRIVAPPTASMTAAGIATLFITQDYLHLDVGTACRGNTMNPALDKGLDWMGTNFQKVVGGGRDFYTLYGIERIGVAAGYKYFGLTDWYDEGASYVISKQNEDGSWGRNDELTEELSFDPKFPTDRSKAKKTGRMVPSQNPHNYKCITDTCFALLFLVRGRAPVVMNKLEYAIDTAGDRVKSANWNQRPRDAANFARWMGQTMERDLNWQIVNLKVPIEDLHDSQILYIAGNQTLNFTPEELGKLKLFIEQGGIIVANADCAGKEFAASVQTIGSTLFPSYEFRELPKDHIIYTKTSFHIGNWKSPPRIMAMSNDVREMIFLFPDGDPARAWQNQIHSGKDEAHQAMANVFLYSVEKRNLRFKGQTYIVERDEKIKAERKAKVARLNTGDTDNWDPEPGGWRRLGNVLFNTKKLDLDVQAVALGTDKLDKSFALAHLTGTRKIKLKDEQVKALKDYIEAGGTLLIDAAGGSREFAVAAEELIGQLTDSKLVVLAPNDPLFKDNGVESVGYRLFAQTLLRGISGPQLRAAKVGERMAIYFSKEDLSAGLVGQTVDGIYGYEPKSATDIVAALVMSTAKGQ